MKRENFLRVANNTFFEEYFVFPYCQNCKKHIHSVSTTTSISYGWVRVIEDETDRDTFVGPINIQITQNFTDRAMEYNNITPNNRLKILAEQGTYRCGECDSPITNYIAYYPCVITGQIANDIAEIGNLRIPIRNPIHIEFTGTDRVIPDIKQDELYAITEVIKYLHDILQYVTAPIRERIPDINEYISTAKSKIDIPVMYEDDKLSLPSNVFLTPLHVQRDVSRIPKRFYSTQSLPKTASSITVYARLDKSSGVVSKTVHKYDQDTAFLFESFCQIQGKKVVEVFASKLRTHSIESDVGALVNGLLVALSPVQPYLNALGLRKPNKNSLIEAISTYRYSMLLTALNIFARFRIIDLSRIKSIIENVLDNEFILISLNHADKGSTLMLFSLQHATRQFLKFTVSTYFSR